MSVNLDPIEATAVSPLVIHCLDYPGYKGPDCPIKTTNG